MTDRVLLTAVIAGTLAAFAFGLWSFLHHVVSALPF